MDCFRKKGEGEEKPKKKSKFFAPNIFFLRSLAMHTPDENWNVFILIIYYLWRLVYLIVTFSIIVLSGWDLYIKIKTEQNQIGNIAMNILYIEYFISISFRSFYFIARAGVTENLVQRARKEFREQTTYSFEPDTTKRADFINKILFNYFMTFVICAAFLMLIGSNITRKLPLPIYRPNFDFTSSPTFEITAFIEFIVTLFMTVGFGNMDMFHSTFMMAISEQFRLLAIDFGNVVQYTLHQCGFSKEEILEYFKYGRDEFASEGQELSKRIINTVESEKFKSHLRKNFTECIEHHKQLLDYFDCYQRFLTMILLLHINMIFLYMIFSLFVFLNINEPTLYPALSQYFWGSLSQIMILSSVGTLLENNVEFMRQSLYSLPWYILDKTFISNFKFVQIRMTKPINITAGKLIVLNLELFLDFVKKAFSFFTVLRRMNQEQL